MSYLGRYPWLNRDLHKRYGVRVVSPVVEEPITLEQAWKHLRLDVDGSPPATEDDDWLEDIGIPAARDWAEHFLEQQVAQVTLELGTQGFPYGGIPLRFGPVRSVESVIYIDGDGVEVTMVADDEYTLNSFTNPATVVPAYGTSWPSAQASANSVLVQYVSGYDLPGDSPTDHPLPAGIRIGILLMLGHLFINREDTIAGPSMAIQEIPKGAVAFLDQYTSRISMA